MQIRKEKTKKGSHFRAVVRYKNFYKSQTFDSKEEAKEWGMNLELALKKGKAKINAVKKDSIIITVKDLIDDFKTNIAPKKYKDDKKYAFIFDWWIEKIGHINVSDLSSSALSQCKNLLINEAPTKPYKNHSNKSNSTVNKYLFCMSAILKYAYRELEIIDHNPMSKVDKLKKKKGVVRFLTESEIDTLLNTAKNMPTKYAYLIYLFILLDISSGGRYSELLYLTVENIDFENEIFHFINTKNGKDRGVPIYTRIMDILKSYLVENNIESGYIFTLNGKVPYMKGLVEKTIKEAGIKNCRIHDFRHTYASHLAMNGANLLEIAELLGHENLNQVQIYAHLTKKHTSKLVRKMCANILNL